VSNARVDLELQRMRPLIHDSVPSIHADQASMAPLALTGKNVVVGIVDTGIDIFHRAFRHTDNAGTTRILSLWDQVLSPTEPGDQHPAGFGYGVVFDDEAINAALAANKRPWRSADEDGHGTHVAGIAAGNGAQPGRGHLAGYYIGVAPEADLVIVKSFGLDHMLDATKYIIDYAKSRGKAVVVNLSQGKEAGSGSHAGVDQVETTIDGYLGQPGVAIVVAAGNDGANGTHAFVHIGANGSKALHFTVPPNDRGIHTVEAWYTGPAQLKVTVTAPTGRAYEPLGPVTAFKPLATVPPGVAGADHLAGRAELGVAPSGRNKVQFHVSRPTDASITTGSVQVPWTIELEELAGAATDVHVWIGYSHGSPIASFVPLDRSVSSTIAVPGTAKSVITVGFYDSNAQPVSQVDPRSSRGPLAFVDPNLPGADNKKPDICAPGKSIFSAKSGEQASWRCCEWCVDFYINHDGTSMAAPHVTGVVALMLQRNRTLTANDVRTHLRSTADPPTPAPQPPLPNNEWGAGMVNALHACQAVPPGPGGGGQPLTGPHFPTSPAAYRTPAARLRAMERRFGGHPLWHELGALVSTHFDEVSRLIASNRRVAVAWHRLGGPTLVFRLAVAQDTAVLPPLVDGRPMDALLERWLAVLDRYGSAALRRDLARHRHVLLALPVAGPAS
jgi:subtilisin family serine protease